ncbi:hypothetical protein, conserved in T.vivax [Trypanosoma vivax Y486]|uniref:Uncharacterized protein n=1 Tax=Trypanosoma vivax (strain Y486) TaxID=1055687 RepID=F9WKA7_TRYVY|nr:hypothetical protein, conserved in T.vivax [Trypanosoma vivax Y486]|eukprot:CCD17927.1 hypothetical protein, conserved in T.vivax [Trypanosoma vivax Y486]
MAGCGRSLAFVGVAFAFLVAASCWAASPKGLATGDAALLCKQAKAFEGASALAAQYAGSLFAMAAEAAANAASVEGAAQVTQAWLAQEGTAAVGENEGGRGKSTARSAADAFLRDAKQAATQLATKALELVCAGRTAAESHAALSGYLLTLGAVATSSASGNGYSCLAAGTKVEAEGTIKTNAHKLVHDICTQHVSLATGKLTAVTQALKDRVALTTGSESEKPGSGRGGNDECPLLGLAATNNQAYAGLVLKQARNAVEDLTGTPTKKSNTDITLGLHVKVSSVSPGTIAFVERQQQNQTRTALIALLTDAEKWIKNTAGPCSTESKTCDAQQAQQHVAASVAEANTTMHQQTQQDTEEQKDTLNVRTTTSRDSTGTQPRAQAQARGTAHSTQGDRAQAEQTTSETAAKTRAHSLLALLVATHFAVPGAPQATQ